MGKNITDLIPCVYLYVYMKFSIETLKMFYIINLDERVYLVTSNKEE